MQQQGQELSHSSVSLWKNGNLLSNVVHADLWHGEQDAAGLIMCVCMQMLHKRG